MRTPGRGGVESTGRVAPGHASQAFNRSPPGPHVLPVSTRVIPLKSSFDVNTVSKSGLFTHETERKASLHKFHDVFLPCFPRTSLNIWINTHGTLRNLHKSPVYFV